MTAFRTSAAPRHGALQRWRLALAGLGLAAACGLAQAGPVVHFDFQASPTNTGHSNLFYNNGGIGITVSAWTTADTPPGVPRSGGYGRVTPAMGSAGGEDAGLYEGTSGLGVFQAGTDNKNLDGGDGAESDEAMMFIFDRQVELTGMNFNFWDAGDSLAIYVDNNWVMNYTGASSDNAVFSLVGTMFVLTATNDATSVRIQDLDVRAIDLPEPGSSMLAGLALAALATTRRRRPARS